MHVHDISLPLMLEEADFDMWLDPTFKHAEAFADLLITKIRHPLVLTPVRSLSDLTPLAESEILPADE